MCRLDDEPTTRATVIAVLILLVIGSGLVVGLAQLWRLVLRV